MKDETMPNPYAAKRIYAKVATPEPTPTPESAPTPEESISSAVPVGTAKEILEWVGGDAERALEAIESEEAAEKPRKVLLADLEKIVNA